MFSIAQETGYDLQAEELNLKDYFQELLVVNGDSNRLHINEKISDLLEDILYDEASLSYPFDSLNKLSVQSSGDGLFRIYTWNLVFSNFSYRFYGFIQYFDKKKNDIIVWKLMDKTSDFTSNVNQITVKNDEWFGAVYYKIIKGKDKRRNYYTLLGWKGKSAFSTQKVIDVLYFTSGGKPRFGAPIFERIPDSKFQGRRVGKQKRVVFEYSAKSVMSMRWDEQLEMIVFDHLVPFQPSMKGHYQYYGPDFTHDAYSLKKGIWIFKANVEPKMKKNKNSGKREKPNLGLRIYSANNK